MEALLPWLDWAYAGARRKRRDPRILCFEEDPIMHRVLIADELSSRAMEIFRSRGIEADVRTGLQPAEIEEVHRRL